MDYSIVEELKTALELQATVHAMWIGGSVAEGYADEFSDIDVSIDIDDGQDQEIFGLVETFLRTKGELDLVLSEGATPPYSHITYHLANMNPYHFFEITLHTHSNEFGLFDRMRKIKVLFDKDGTTDFKPFEKESYESYEKMLQERKKYLIKKVSVGELAVRKEIARRQFMDAMHNYQFWLVEPIIELARIKYAPLKITYNLKHGSRDLPASTVKEIESLYFISSLDDLNIKIDEIKAMAKKYSR